MGAVHTMFPRYNVPIQLNILMAEGTATSIVSTENTRLEYRDWPLTNM